MQTMRRWKMPTELVGPASFSECFTVVQRRKMKFAQIRGYLYLRTVLVLMKGEYQKKRKGMESLKMQTMRQWKMPTDLDGPASFSESLSVLLHREKKFAQIWGYFYLGTTIALMKGTYEKKGKGMESLKMQIMRRCK